MPQRTRHNPSSQSRMLSRRAVLRYSAGSGAALAAAALSAIPSTAAAEPGQSGQGGAARPAPATVRRVVTGLNAAGKSYIVSDERVPVNSIWTTSGEQMLGPGPVGEANAIRSTGESRLYVAAIQPSKAPKPDLTNRIGFHRAAGVAYCYILNGEIVLLTDTQEVTVRAGEIIVERHALHSWRNEQNEPINMLITTVVGA